MKIYLAGPINGCTDSEANDWRSFVKNNLILSWDTIDPMRRDYRGKELSSANEIVVLDKLDVANCDVFFANCPKPSVGTSMEIFYAHSLGKIIVAVVPEGVTPSPWLIYHCTKIFTSLTEAVKWINDEITNK